MFILNSNRAFLLCYFLFLTWTTTGSSIRDESLHSTVTQKQSIDSMTMPRCQSFKIQSSNQFKLKSNFKNKSKSSTLIQCPQNVNLPIERNEKESNKTIIYTRTTGKSEHDFYGPQINANAFHFAKGNILVNENQIRSTELLSMAPNIETNSNNNKIRLTIAPIHVHTKRTKHTCHSTLRRSTTQPIFRPWFNWFRPKKNAAFYSPPLEHSTNKKGIKIHIDSNESPSRVQAIVNVDSSSSSNENEDEEISNSSLQNVDRASLKDELAAYMDEIRAREKR